MKIDKTQELLNLASELRWQVGEGFHDTLIEGIYADAADIAQKVEIKQGSVPKFSFERQLYQILTSKRFGFPIMILVLSIILWLTIQGANYPSGLLSTLFLEIIYPFLKSLSSQVGLPWWMDGFLLDGVYLAL